MVFPASICETTTLEVCCLSLKPVFSVVLFGALGAGSATWIEIDIPTVITDILKNNTKFRQINATFCHLS